MSALVRYEEMRDVQPYVYFVQRPSTGAVKIGFSSNPVRRFAQLQTSSDEPLLFLAAMHGNRAMERFIHQKFSSTRLNGEWFAWSSEFDWLIIGINYTPPETVLAA